MMHLLLLILIASPLLRGLEAPADCPAHRTLEILCNTMAIYGGHNGGATMVAGTLLEYPDRIRCTDGCPSRGTTVRHAPLCLVLSGFTGANKPSQEGTPDGTPVFNLCIGMESATGVRIPFNWGAHFHWETVTSVDSSQQADYASRLTPFEDTPAGGGQTVAQLRQQLLERGDSMSAVDREELQQLISSLFEENSARCTSRTTVKTLDRGAFATVDELFNAILPRYALATTFYGSAVGAGLKNFDFCTGISGAYGVFVTPLCTPASYEKLEARFIFMLVMNRVQGTYKRDAEGFLKKVNGNFDIFYNPLDTELIDIPATETDYVVQAPAVYINPCTGTSPGKITYMFTLKGAQLVLYDLEAHTTYQFAAEKDCSIIDDLRVFFPSSCDKLMNAIDPMLRENAEMWEKCRSESGQRPSVKTTQPLSRIPQWDAAPAVWSSVKSAPAPAPVPGEPLSRIPQWSPTPAPAPAPVRAVWPAPTPAASAPVRAVRPSVKPAPAAILSRLSPWGPAPADKSASLEKKIEVKRLEIEYEKKVIDYFSDPRFQGSSRDPRVLEARKNLERHLAELAALQAQQESKK